MSDWFNRWEALRKVYKKRSLPIHNWRIADNEPDPVKNEPKEFELVSYDWASRMKPQKSKPPAIIHLDPPANEEEIIIIEKEMGCSIPSSFRNVLKQYSRKVDVCWMFPVDDEEYKTIYDHRFRYFSWGILYWSLEELPTLQKKFQEWLINCYNDPNDSYGKHWYGKFPVCEVGCGDFTVIENERENSQQVVYLSHDGDCKVNGFPMGKDFEDFVDRMSLLGCPSEGFSLYPFIDSPKPYLQIDNENARLWRQWFGLEN
jgi:hypothetical protein